MTDRHALPRVLGLGTLMALVGCSTLPPMPDTALKATSSMQTDWPAYGGSPESAQFSPLAQVDRSNVAQLEVAWQLPVSPHPNTTSPIVVGERIYTVIDDAVVALHVADGHEIWRAPDSAGKARGVAYWPGGNGHPPRILSTVDDALIALRADTGARIAEFGTDGRVDLREGLGRPREEVGKIQSATPGRIFENLIIVGSSTGEAYGAAPGDIRAYDVVTGAPAWTFRTLPAAGDPGAETWPRPPRPYVGGANAWGELTLDAKNGILFVPTGSATYDFYGADRAGDNLYANSLLALDARTGRRRWHFQTVHHDLWDYDNAQAPKLLTVMRGGSPVDIVLLAGKTGYVYTFERTSGKPFFPIPETPVPASDVPGEAASPTQPIPTLPAPFARQKIDAEELSPLLDPAERSAYAQLITQARNEGIFTPPSLRGTIQFPGNHGGGQFGNGAVDPARARFYVASLDQPALLKLERRRPPASRSVLAASPAALYAQECAGCHGADARGQPPMVPPLAGITARLTASAFATTLREGRGQMPSFTALPDAQVTALRELLDAAAQTPSVLALPLAATPGDTSLTGAETGDGIHDTREPVSARGRPQPYFSGYNFLLDHSGLPAVRPPWSTLTAYDMASGATLWRVPYGTNLQAEARGLADTGASIPKASLIATAGGLLFSATPDRMLRAWDADTGRVIWSYPLPAQPQAIPAVYAWQGHQYLLIAATASGAGPMQMGPGHAEEAYRNTLLAFRLPAGS